MKTTTSTVALLIFLLLSSASIAFADSDWYEWLHPDGTIHRYKLITTLMTWNEAEIHAESLGGYLATVTSQAENDFLWNTFDLSSPQPTPMLGGFQLPGTPEPNTGWQWITGEKWEYTNWATGQPDDAWGGQDYLAFYAGNGWDDNFFDILPYPSIVEVSGSEPPTPAEQIQEILNFVNDSVASGTLSGEGTGPSAENNLNTFIKQLELVQSMIAMELPGLAIEKLLQLHKQCDGQDQPKDKVIGEAVDELSAKIKALIESIEVFTDFEVPHDTWGQSNPGYSSGINAIEDFLANSPLSEGGSCFGLTVLNLRWFDARRDLFGFLPRLRTVYDDSPAWVQEYTAGILQHTESIHNTLDLIRARLEADLTPAKGVAASLKVDINIGNPVLVVQYGIQASGATGIHAVVAFGYKEDLDKIYFLIADPNFPHETETLYFDKNWETWDYYWAWSDFRVAGISIQDVCD